MSDTLQRFLLEGTPVRGEIVRLDATWRAVLERRDYPEHLKTLLGEMVAAGALLSATLKFDGALIMQMQGEGPVRLLVVEVTSKHTLRATAKWDGEIVSSGIRALLGNGKFVITIAPESGKQAYQGVVSLDGDTVAEVLEHYMAKSEQLDTRLWLASDENKAGGMLLQRLPEHPEYDEDAWNRATTIGETITDKELLTLSARDIIHRLYHQEDIRLFEERPTAFRCSCTRERVTAMLRLLGKEEVQSILTELGHVEVGCEFCGRQYQFDPVDAEQVFASEIQRSAGQTKH
jgi:molecular chaperone Hsp33